MIGTAKGTKTSAKVLAVSLTALLTLGIAGCKSDSAKTGTDSPSTGSQSPPTTGSTTTNRAPTITGIPLTVAKTTLPYSFQPTASDPDGDKLVFSINGKPDWTTFSTSTGRLQGTPPADGTGTYTGVQITVSDGKTSTAMPAFSIDVVPPTVGSAELAWQPPTLNDDGTPLEDLAGYVIRYGRSASVQDQVVRIDNSGVTRYVVENLSEGVWYFTLSSVNSAGVESRPTGFVSKSIG